MALDELQGAKTRRYFIDISGTKETNQFIYRQPFGIHFRYRHQVDFQNIQRHGPISLDRKWMTKFCSDCNFTWYLDVLKVNTSLVSGHFENDGVVQPSLYFLIYLAIECLKKKIGYELGQNRLPKRTSKIPIYVLCEKISVKHHGGMWEPSKTKWEK